MSNLYENGYLHLCRAIKRGNKATVRNLILHNAVVNSPKERDNTPLHLAIVNFNDTEIIKMLLDRGANIHAKNNNDCTPLEIAIQRNKTKVASLLIRRGAIDRENFDLFLVKAIHHDNHTIVNMIMEYGMEYSPSINLFTFLQDAILQRNAMMIKAIIPHCGFSKPSDLYIPRDLVMECGRQSRECVELLAKWNFIVHPNSHCDEYYIYGAVQNGHLPIVIQLLERGIDVNMVNPRMGLNLLMIACLKKHHKIVKKLLQHDANAITSVNDKMILNANEILYALANSLPLNNDNDNSCNITCLHVAVFNSDLKTTKILLRYRAGTIDDQELFEVFCLAVLNNNEDIVRILLDHGVNVRGIDSKRATILYHCLLPQSYRQDLTYDITKLLLEEGADVHLQTPGNDFVFEAVTNGHHKIAQLFLDYNADTQYIDPDGNTLLHAAIKERFTPQFIEILLKCHSSVHSVNNDGQTPLHFACFIVSIYQLKVVKVLLKYNADIHFTDKSLMTPLHYACGVHNLKLVEMFLNKGANPNVKNHKGQTPLHIVCQRYSVRASELIELLLKHDANIEAMDEDGRTPLFEACLKKGHTAIECLLDHHANINHTDKEKLTPLLFAVKNFSYHLPVIKTLLEHNANVYCTDMERNSIIHLIVHAGNRGLIEYFVDTDINFNSINKHGFTPLHLAVKKCDGPMIKLLLRHGANINVVNTNNRTPLQETIVGKLTGDEDSRWSITPLIIVLVKQVITLKVAGMKVNDDNLVIVYNSDHGIINYNNYLDERDRLSDIQRFEAECEGEIEKMKTESVGINGLTFHDLLKENIHLLGRFVDNKTIQQTLEQKVYDKQFPLYIDIIRSRFREAKIRHKRYILTESAIKCFRMIINQRLPDECIEMVLHYLNIEELNMFINAVKLNILYVEKHCSYVRYHDFIE